MTIPLFAYFIRDWRKLTIVSSALGLPAIFVWWYVLVSLKDFSDSTLFVEHTSDFQCCNGQCIDKPSQCYSLVPILSLTFLAVGVVIVCIIGCCCRYPSCPGFRQYQSRSMCTYIIESQTVYRCIGAGRNETSSDICTRFARYVCSLVVVSPWETRKGDGGRGEWGPILPYLGSRVG